MADQSKCLLPLERTRDLNSYTMLAFLSGYDDSFYHDSYYEAYDDPETSQYGDPLITNHRLKKSKPLYVNYARTAKRVDVKKLKENLWKVLVSNKVMRLFIPVIT